MFLSLNYTFSSSKTKHDLIKEVYSRIIQDIFFNIEIHLYIRAELSIMELKILIRTDQEPV